MQLRCQSPGQKLQALFNPTLEFTMTTLSAIAHDVIGSYGDATQHLAGAWRARTSRVVEAGNRRFASDVDSRAIPLVSAGVKGSLIEAEVEMAGWVTCGVDLPVLGTEKAVGLLASGLTRSVDFVAGNASRIESPAVTRAMSALGKLALPGAQMALELATSINSRAKRLHDGMTVTADEAAEPVAAAAQVEAGEVTETLKVKAKAKSGAPVVMP
jgi:hypothetical protein